MNNINTDESCNNIRTHATDKCIKSTKIALGHLLLEGLCGHPILKEGQHKLLLDTPILKSTFINAIAHSPTYTALERSAHKLNYPRRNSVNELIFEFSEHIRNQLNCMLQSEDHYNLIHRILTSISGESLSTRLCTKRPLNTEASIYNFDDSSNTAHLHSLNATLSGLTHKTDLALQLNSTATIDQLDEWFDGVWGAAKDVTPILKSELENSWAAYHATPYDIYLKSLFSLAEHLVEDVTEEVLWNDEIIKQLADFQSVAVRQAVKMINQYGGAFVSDVVGLGKSFIGAAIIKQFVRTDRVRPLIICPAALTAMWENYSERYELNARVLSVGMLRFDKESDTNILLEDPLLQNRDFVLIDESHNFRNPNTQRYILLEEYLAQDRKCCLLTATPRNKSALDIYNQLKLFHQEDLTTLPINPPNLRQYFRRVEAGTAHLHDLLSNILIRRTRKDVLKWYGFDSVTDEKIDPQDINNYWTGSKRAYVMIGDKPHYFPRRRLETVQYDIDQTYDGLYATLKNCISGVDTDHDANPVDGQMTYARYGLWHYVSAEKKYKEPYTQIQSAGNSLHGLMRVLLFKRLESSIEAFRQTIRRILKNHQRFLEALNGGVVAAGQLARDILNQTSEDESYFSSSESDFISKLYELNDTYAVEDFDVKRLRQHIRHDCQVLEHVLSLVSGIGVEQDAKIAVLRDLLNSPTLQNKKCLVFSEYAETAKYLHENLTDRTDIDIITSQTADKMKLVAAFSPKANPEYSKKAKHDINLLVATDVLSEGLNLQDAAAIINYDLHWNPVRLIQRFGRIDRIGSEHEEILGYNFLPATEIEQELGLQASLSNRIQEIHDTIGEDSAILCPTERLNQESLYAIYEGNNDFNVYEENENEPTFDINEAFEMLRSIQVADPDEFERIRKLPDGIRSSAVTKNDDLMVHMRAGEYHQLILIDNEGHEVTRDTHEVLAEIKCLPDAIAGELPSGFNKRIVEVQRAFSNEVEDRLVNQQSRRKHTVAQRYAVSELRSLIDTATDDDQKARIVQVLDGISADIPAVANRELGRIRSNRMTGAAAFDALVDIYHNFDLASYQSKTEISKNQLTPQIVCSLAK